ncbi:MAG TPA: substrate-binding domain-containing protein [Candidatus Limnocylindria bacterium]|nr:substrate-binding domain-containing protein [Candidatus Limnocylindria bacterium]
MNVGIRPVLRAKRRLMSAGLLTALLTAVSCGGAGSTTAPNAFGGRFLMSTGGGAQGQVTALTKRFTELHPGLNWIIENVGSDAGISLVVSKHSDLGAISRDLTAAEKGTVTLDQLGVVGTGVAVNPDNPIKGLALAQIRQMFSGELTNWSQVGGPDLLVRVFVRDITAATRQSFDDYVFAGTTATYATAVATVGSNAEMIASIRSFAGGIGMATLKQATVDDPKLKLLAIDGVPATMAALNDGSYSIRRPLYLVSPKDPATMKPEVKLFLDFVRSPEGQKILGGL